MKVLMISGDPGALDPNTETGNRTEEYRNVLGELDVVVCRGNIFNFVFGFFRGLKMARRKQYDIITAQDMEHAVLAWVLSKIFSTPWQMQIHTDILSPYFVRHSVSNKIRVRLAKFLILRADCVRVVSERVRKSIEGKEGEVIVLPIFVDVEKIRQTPVKTDLHKKYPGRFIILMASRITREKNIGLAIEAMSSRLIRTNKPILLLVVGDGPEREALKLQTINYKLQTTVVFEPTTPDLISYYKTCDLFLLISNYEGYGRTLVEAAAAGAKIISSDVGVAPEILDTEAVFKVGNREDLKQKLVLALENKLPTPSLPALPTKEEYLKLYKNSFEICLKK